jgi:hypothetical protein
LAQVKDTFAEGSSPLGSRVRSEQCDFREPGQGEVRRINPTAPLSMIALRSVGWSTLGVSNIGDSGSFLGSQKGISDYSMGHSA